MGADGSKGKRYQEAARYGQIYVQTDNSTYFGGETVTGRIYLNLLIPYPGNQLFLKFKGKEAVHFVHQRQENYHTRENGQQVTKTRYIDELYEEKHDVIKMMVPIYSWATLMPGQYTIPFAFMLPSHLPSSFFQEGYRYLASISYRLEAVLEPSFKHEPRLKSKQNFVVRQPVKNAQQGTSHEVQTPLKTCCCCAKGSNILKAQFEKNFYAPGETAQVIMQLNNSDSTINNSRLSFTLKQRVNLTARGKTESKNFTKVQRDLPGIQAGGQSDSSLIAINLPHFTGGDYSKIKAYNMTQYLLNLKEDNSILNPATRGRLITSEYYLEVSAPMDGCCAPTPSISTPIEIYYPEFKFTPVTMPANWAPQEVGLVNVAFGANVQQPGMNINVNIDPNMMVNTMNNQMMATNQMMGGNMTMTTNIQTNQMPESTLPGQGQIQFNTQDQFNNGQAQININFNGQAQFNGQDQFNNGQGGFH